MTEINSRGLLRDKQFEFRPELSTTFQLARFQKKFLREAKTGAFFMDVTKDFDFVWIEDLLFNLTILESPLTHTPAPL